MKGIGILLVILLTASPVRALEVRVSAAASLTDAIRELTVDYHQRYPGVEVQNNFASSGALARQIDAGAPVDIYISANSRWMDFLAQRGAIAEGSRRVLARNSLVFVGAPGSKVASLQDLSSLQRIALGTPKAVPAGLYAEQALKNAGIHQELLAAQKLVFAKDVRQALLYADQGEVDGAFVYRTDASLAKHAMILFEVPRELYSPVVYPAALVKDSAEKPEVMLFFTYLFGPEARQVFARYGFQKVE